MRDLIDFATQRGTLLHPEALRWLQGQSAPLSMLERALPADDDLPLVVTIDALQRWWGASHEGQAGAFASASSAARVVDAGLRGPVAPPAPAPEPGGLASESRLDGFGPSAGGAPARPAPGPPGGARGPASGTPVPGSAPQVPSPLAPQVPHEVLHRAHGLPPELAVRPNLNPLDPLVRRADEPPDPRQGAPILAPPVGVLKDISGQSTCTGELGDFTRYFNDRLRLTRRILRRRRELVGVVPIDKIPRNQSGVVRLIGIVSDVRTTKNGYRIIELEDETGVVPLLVPRDDHRTVELGDAAERVMRDEVIGVHAQVRPGKDILYLQDLFRPDVELDFEPRRATEPAVACFLSDTHFGAKSFLGNVWDRFVRWLNGKEGTEQERALAQRVKYVVVAGDMVDGVGVYPGQDTELAIPDIEGQYAHAAKEFARVPSRVRVVLLPGNHDAVRPAEPQPAMAEKYRKGYGDNVTFVGNPCSISLMGVEVLAYHGVSLIDYMTSLRGLDVHKPVAIMEEVLKRRHIAPMYGGSTPFAPEARDYLVIDRVPDIFVAGHLHTCDIGSYRNVTLINAGAWQGQTSYQKVLGIRPEPGRVPYVDLQTGRGGMLRFDTGLVKPDGTAA